MQMSHNNNILLCNQVRIVSAFILYLDNVFCNYGMDWMKNVFLPYKTHIYRRSLLF